MTEGAKARKREYDRKWREAHKKEIKEYREQNKEKIKSQIKNYKDTHKEDISNKNKIYQKKYHIEHKEECRQYNKMLYQKAKETMFTNMYIFPENVIILDSKTVSYNNKSYRIISKGYLKGDYCRLHIAIAKDMGIWFKGCEIHHIDGSVFNNSKDNLIALTPEQHKYAHKLLKHNKETYYKWVSEIK